MPGNGLADAGCAAQRAPAQANTEGKVCLQHIIPARFAAGRGELRQIFLFHLLNGIALAGRGLYLPFHGVLRFVSIGVYLGILHRQRMVAHRHKITAHAGLRNSCLRHLLQAKLRHVFLRKLHKLARAVQPEFQNGLRVLRRIRAQGGLVVVVYPVQRAAETAQPLIYCNRCFLRPAGAQAALPGGKHLCAGSAKLLRGRGLARGGRVFQRAAQCDGLARKAGRHGKRLACKGKRKAADVFQLCTLPLRRRTPKGDVQRIVLHSCRYLCILCQPRQRGDGCAANADDIVFAQGLALGQADALRQFQ